MKEMRGVFQRLEAEGYALERQVGARCTCGDMGAGRPSELRSWFCFWPARRVCKGGAASSQPQTRRRRRTPPPMCQAVWRQHWDFQLAKALEVQFARGLEGITQSLPEVRVPELRLGHQNCSCLLPACPPHTGVTRPPQICSAWGFHHMFLPVQSCHASPVPPLRLRRWRCKSCCAAAAPC